MIEMSVTIISHAASLVPELNQGIQLFSLHKHSKKVFAMSEQTVSMITLLFITMGGQNAMQSVNISARQWCDLKIGSFPVVSRERQF